MPKYRNISLWREVLNDWHFEISRPVAICPSLNHQLFKTTLKIQIL